jgi:hypothetical protein
MNLRLQMKFHVEVYAVHTAIPLLIANAVNHFAQILFSDT